LGFWFLLVVFGAFVLFVRCGWLFIFVFWSLVVVVVFGGLVDFLWFSTWMVVFYFVGVGFGGCFGYLLGWLKSFFVWGSFWGYDGFLMRLGFF